MFLKKKKNNLVYTKRFTFLTIDEMYFNPLDIIKKESARCAITDFSILLGGFVSGEYYVGDGNSRKDRAGGWWTKSPDCEYGIYLVTPRGRLLSEIENEIVGSRPATKFSSIANEVKNKVINENGILEVEYGEYPQDIVEENTSKILEDLYQEDKINRTGKKYKVSWTYDEFEYQEKKYIRVKCDSNCEGQILSDGRTIQKENAYWVEVSPIKWIIDEKTNVALSKRILFAGISLGRPFSYMTERDFDSTHIEYVLNNIFAEDIIPSISKEIVLEEEQIKSNKTELVENKEKKKIKVKLK